MRIVALFLMTIILSSCSEFNRRKNNETWATGKPGEILVVCTDELWQSVDLDSFFVKLSPAEAPYYPSEYAFRFIQRNVTGFNSNFKKSRNILVIERHNNAKYSPASINIIQNKWVRGQVVVELFFKDLSDLNQLPMQEVIKIYEALEQAELNRYVKHFISKSNFNTKQLVREKYGIELDFPTGIDILNDVDDFIRFDIPDRSREMPLDGGSGIQTSKANFILSSVMIWQQVYVDAEQLSFQNILSYQDSVLKKYAPHEKQGAYLATEYDTLVYPIANKMSIGGIEITEIKGQYRIRGRSDVFMGGPFVSYTFLNPKTNKIITLFGMVHGPSEPLLTYIREHKALIRTLKI